MNKYIEDDYIEDGYYAEVSPAGEVDYEANRIFSLMPAGWFGDAPPFVSALIYGFAAINAFLFSLISYAKLQTRIKTATDGFLDLIALDFFGYTLVRKSGQTNDSFRNTIIANLFRERGTRKSITSVIKDITGTTPEIFEPSLPKDTGGYGLAVCGYGAAGRYGSLSLPYQSFVTVTKPKVATIPLVAGYRVPVGAYSTNSRIKYSSLSEMPSSASDADIYQAIESVRPSGTVIWVRII
jgi:hypothetical protein